MALSASHRSGLQIEAVPGSGPDLRDFGIMLAMTMLYLLLSLYNLGDFTAPSTTWQPSKGGVAFDLDFGREIRIGRIYYYSGINESRYDNARFFVLYRKGDAYFPLTEIEKKECGAWRFSEVDVSTSRLKIVANPPGGALNEMAFVEKGHRTPVGNFTIMGERSGDNGDPWRLFDEQEKLEYLPSFKSGFYFDEIYHARTAFEYLQGMEPYETTHPPLGKLLIASGIALFGMNPIGWRLPGVLFGAAMLPVMYLFGLKLFSSRFLAFSGAFLIMVDFMHFTHTRLAVIDVYPTLFVMLMFYFMYDFYLHATGPAIGEARITPLFLSGICFGLGAASKWISLYAGVGLALLIVLQLLRTCRKGSKEVDKRNLIRGYLLPLSLCALLFFVVLPSLIYLLAYLPFFFIKSGSHGMIDVLRNQRDMFAYHSQLKASHPFSSPWWSWPLNLRPVWLYTGSGLPAGTVSTIASFGNPVVWWAGIPAAIIAAITAGVRRDRRMTVVFMGMACQYLPWALIPRLAFIYHFFSVVPFMVLAQLYVMERAMATWPRARFGAYAYLCLAGVMFVLFYPLLSGRETAESYIAGLRWLKTWTF